MFSIFFLLILTALWKLSAPVIFPVYSFSLFREASFIGTKCNYAVKFYKDYVYLLSKCKINEQQKSLLEKVNN